MANSIDYEIFLNGISSIKYITKIIVVRTVENSKIQYWNKIIIYEKIVGERMFGKSHCTYISLLNTIIFTIHMLLSININLRLISSITSLKV